MQNIKKVAPQDNEFLQRITDIDNPAKCLWYIGNLPKRRPTRGRSWQPQNPLLMVGPSVNNWLAN